MPRSRCSYRKLGGDADRGVKGIHGCNDGGSVFGPGNDRDPSWPGERSNRFSPLQQIFFLKLPRTNHT